MGKSARVGNNLELDWLRDGGMRVLVIRRLCVSTVAPVL